MLYSLPFIIAGMFLLLMPGLSLYYKNYPDYCVACCAHLFTLHYCAYAGQLLKSGATAKIFSTAMFVICTMTFIQLLANSGVINNFFIEEHSITMGSLLENIIIAFGLFYNLLQERKQRESRCWRWKKSRRTH